jgi:LexA-binding, inner membrane-associated putative hydrolase
MSWAAHELESMILHRHADRPGKVWRISYMAILVGALMADFTKLPVYGLHIGHWELIKAPEPWMYHRGWPGSGPTHSLVAGILAAAAVYVVTRSKGWGIGILIGYWSHVLTDTADSVGVMMFFPFTTQHYNFGMWQYASQAGRYGDAAAYYSSLGWAWDVVWLLLLILLAREVLTAEYFHTRVEPADPFWGVLQRRFRVPDHLRRAIFRAYVVYGAARLVGWFLWARLVNPTRGVETMDLSWTGPGWVQAPPRFQEASTWGGFAVVTLVGLLGTALTAYVAWWALRRLPERRRAVALAPISPTALLESASSPSVSLPRGRPARMPVTRSASTSPARTDLDVSPTLLRSASPAASSASSNDVRAPPIGAPCARSVPRLTTSEVRGRLDL